MLLFPVQQGALAVGGVRRRSISLSLKEHVLLVTVSFSFSFWAEYGRPFSDS